MTKAGQGPAARGAARTRCLRLVLGDQLHPRLASLRDLDPERDVILMLEVADETGYVRHHKQKIAYLLAAMRHFAAERAAEGLRVDYVRLDAAGNTGSFTGELARAVARHRPERVVLTEPGEWRVEAMMRGWGETLGLPVEVREDDRFLCPRTVFSRFAERHPALRMETFYRAMRRRTGYLMREGEPVGGRWNLDRENRAPLPRDVRPPERLRFAPDATTRAVLDLVGERFAGHFGDITPFGWPVTRADALSALAHFVATALPRFGDYQDAMRAGEPFLYHALVSVPLNAGLLVPDEVCEAALEAYVAGAAPLNAVEGFVRQIIGWREFVRGIYWHHGPDYAGTNHLAATRPLPWFYWSGETALNCLAQAVGDTRRHAYAHHIQRLMITGNFALLAGLAPGQVEEWYLAVYADAYEWVELPNTHGMVLFADGGIMGSKPYAASGAYIDRMSDYCRACAYDVRAKTGATACPFNLLYWDFLMRHEARLAHNPRLAMPYRTLARMTPERRATIRTDAARFLASPAMSPHPLPASEGRPEAEREVAAGTPDLFLVEEAR